MQVSGSIIYVAFLGRRKTVFTFGPGFDICQCCSAEAICFPFPFYLIVYSCGIPHSHSCFCFHCCFFLLFFSFRTYLLSESQSWIKSMRSSGSDQSNRGFSMPPSNLRMQKLLSIITSGMPLPCAFLVELRGFLDC